MKTPDVHATFTLNSPQGEFVRNPRICSMDYTKIITIEPGKRGGKPCIRGLRITVEEVLGYLASGMTEEQVLEDLPDLTRGDLDACKAFAASQRHGS